MDEYTKVMLAVVINLSSIVHELITGGGLEWHSSMSILSKYGIRVNKG